MEYKRADALHLELEEKIRGRIQNEWNPGDKIPSENELSRQYGVCRMTARSVVTKMVGEGLLYRVSGKGTYVAEPTIVSRGYSYASIREQLEQQGYEINTTILKTEEILPSSKVAKALELSNGDKTYSLQKG